MTDFVESAPEPFEFLPIEDEPLDAEAAANELERQLEDDSFSDTDLVVEEERAPIGRSWAFDFGRNSFVVGHKAKSPLETHGIETLRGWVLKCLFTARGAHAIHPDGYGLVQPFDLIGEPVLTAPAADMEERIRDALTFHPRITDVTDFIVDVDPDEEYVEVSFTVELDDETSESFDNVSLVG